jgi:hypothetical protein
MSRDRSLPVEFRHAALIERIVRGAVERDSVRLHGAVVAALEIHGPASAGKNIFEPALQAVSNRCAAWEQAAAAAISDHLAGLPWSAS